MSHDIYLVGSVPMANAEQVFETVSAALGPRIKRIPDGETGERGDWITWLEPVFAASPALEKSGEFFRVHATGTGRERYKLKAGRKPEDVHFDNLHYADIAKRSYAAFKRLKDAGKIAPGTKFQIDLVPAHSVIWLYLVDALHAPVDPIYNEAVKREIDKIAAALPHDEIAIQFDVASAVFARLERNDASSYGRTKEETQATFSNILIDLGNRVPADIDLMFHLCYGDSNHKHVVEPTDMGDMVEFANRVSRADQAADPAHPHAGAAQPRRRRLFRAAAEAEASSGDAALPRSRALHRWAGGYPKSPGHCAQIRQGFRGRNRMRLRPARSENDTGVAAHPRAGRRVGLD